MNQQTCPLCGEAAEKIAENRITSFYHCLNCFGVSADQKRLLLPEEEKKRYDSHDNRIDDDRYLSFLSKLSTPLKKYISAGTRGLDFGCGPVKAMEYLLGKDYLMESYDHYFYPDQTLLTRKYDFILASEVMEHLYHPAQVFSQLVDILEDKGYLGIMTQSWSEQTNFSTWWYALDPTHVFFYHPKTFEYLCQKYRMQLLEASDSVFILQKN